MSIDHPSDEKNGIPLLSHAALSGDVALVEMLATRGAKNGMSMALSLAVNKGHIEVARWLLVNGSPDLTRKDWRGKTILEVAVENGNVELSGLLRSYGAQG